MSSSKPLLRALAGETLDRPPFWLMRQAGRYLPEYRALRAKAGGFLEMCLTPDMATEVTLQPIRRFGMDGAILFSDILIIPWALGQPLSFQEGEGPKLEPIRSVAEMQRVLSRARLVERAAPVYETVRRLRASLPAETTLIGFAGAPWTVACYMVEGEGSKDYSQVKRWAFSDPAGFARLMDLLVDATVEHLSSQIEAGAEAVKLFDSWAGVLAPQDFRAWVIEPTRRIAAALKQKHPAVPVIGFPRQGSFGYEAYTRETGVDAVALDTTVPPAWAAQTLQPLKTVQGNLDPIRLVAGGEVMRTAVLDILRTLADGPFIFNLGHGVIPQTPPDHVAELADLIRSWPSLRRS